MELLPSPKVASVVANFFAGSLPTISARITYAYWVRTRRTQRSKREMVCFQQAKKSTFRHNGENIALYAWGQGPSVLLIHGWNGRATQFFAMIENLCRQGYSVLSFDAPAHGDSSGNQTNLNQLLSVVSCLNHDYGEFEAIIAHSFGFMVAVNSLKSDIKCRAAIGLASPADYPLLLKAFTDFFGLNSKAEIAFIHFLKINYGLKNLDEISIHHIAKKLHLPCLVVHDKKDKRVPISEAFKIVNAWHGSELYLSNAGGHFRILLDQQVIDKCLTFLGTEFK